LILIKTLKTKKTHFRLCTRNKFDCSKLIFFSHFATLLLLLLLHLFSEVTVQILTLTEKRRFIFFRYFWSELGICNVFFPFISVSRVNRTVYSTRGLARIWVLSPKTGRNRPLSTHNSEAKALFRHKQTVRRKSFNSFSSFFTFSFQFTLQHR